MGGNKVYRKDPLDIVYRIFNSYCNHQLNRTKNKSNSQSAVPCIPKNIFRGANKFPKRTATMTTPLVMRIVALSINSSKKAGEIIRNVMSSKQLNIVEKVRRPS